MGRLRLRDFRGGLYLTGPRESMPAGTLRRARGLSVVRAPSLRSRTACSNLDSFSVASPIHSIVRFNSERYVGIDDTLYREGSALSGSAAAQDGEPLRFLAAPPSPGKADWLYVAGGGTLFKTDGAGTVRNWGIDPPDDGFAAALAAQLSKTIDAFDDAVTPYANSGADISDQDPSPTADATTTVSTRSLRLTVPASKSCAVEKTFATIDLTDISGNDSPDEDIIVLWVHINHPARVEELSIAFSSAGTDFTKQFTREIQIEDSVGKKRVKKEKGLGSLVQIRGQDLEWLTSEHTTAEDLSVQELLGTQKAVATRGTWTRLRLPKSTFTASDETNCTWADIRGIRLGVRTNAVGQAKVWFDSMTLLGGVGMQGDYKYLVTFRNDTLGIRSNANATPVTIENVERQSVELTNLPVSTDPQVDKKEIWRTLGNGSVYFLCAELDNATTTYTDSIADYAGLHSNATYLDTEVLPTDNLQPFATFTDVVGLHYGRAFWLDGAAANRGRVYYSPIGLPESVAGFIEVTNTDEQTQRLVLWNDALYVFTQKWIYLITGTTEPFTAQRIPGSRGTIYPRSIVGTERGIIFRANDGIRIFTGTTTERLSVEAFDAVYAGESVGNLTPLGADVVATWGRDEYVISDGTQTWCWNLSAQIWARDLGLGFGALYTEDDTGYVVGGLSNAAGTTQYLTRLDTPGQYQDVGNAAIDFEVETSGFTIRSAEPALIQRCILEIDTAGQEITPTVLIDDDEITLPIVTTTTQTAVELPVMRKGRRFALRLEGELTDGPVEIVAIEWDAPDVANEQLA